MRTDSLRSRLGVMAFALTIFCIAPVAIQIGMNELVERFGVVSFVAGSAAVAAVIWFIASFRRNRVETVCTTIHFIIELVAAVGIVSLLFWFGIQQLMDRLLQDLAETRLLVWIAVLTFLAAIVWLSRWAGRLIFGDDTQSPNRGNSDDAE